MIAEGLNVEFSRHLEQELHRPEIRASRDAVSALLANDFMEFGSSGGIYDKAITTDALALEAPSDPSALPEVYDFTVKPFTTEAVLVLYRSVRRSDGVAPEKQTLRSSIWKLIDGRWQMFFHQGTVVPQR
ncbi:DUF4440 domain-containing protein [Rhizobium tubonense]|uniref:DUF4440 domain-containing protein n=1 Tax=Rhizobium tubonense TaxID=484088 RepID=A0A2W4CK04_9HYPH|nr:DUF4440 domain-containing protein [Rhizobium tubonense]PZM13209.1 DUF4440 domain-containing protein [Rhizobium tubonense]